MFAADTFTFNGGLPCSQFYGDDRNIWRPRIGNDVTDNKTSEFSIPKQYTMSDIFHREEERLKTFDTWPIECEWLDKRQLAQSGMFFTGEGDKVKCYFCEVEIGRWEREDQPVSEHLRWSPNCPLLRRRTTNNAPISVEELDRILPPMSYDICGANEPVEVRPNSYAPAAPAMARMMTSTAADINLPAANSSSNSTTYFPEIPEYAIEAARVRSFAEWPRNMKQKPEQLAEAGFFYTGVGDRVKCFSCGGGLKDWDDSDEPWEQHALWMSKCRFLKLMKGPTFVDAIIAKQKAKDADAEAVEKSVEMAAIAQPKATALACSVNPNCDDDAVVNQATMANSEAGSAAVRICEAIAASEQNLTSEMGAEKKSHVSIPEEKLCKICYADEYNTAFLPCGHVVACAKCASSVMKCPLCRKPFTDVMRVYFS